MDLLGRAACLIRCWRCFGQIAFALILVVFMLTKKEDLRDRLIRVACPHRVAAAMKALDDASSRMSRYLCTQTRSERRLWRANWAPAWRSIGVKYALLWAFWRASHATCRILGIWLGAVPPIVFTLATADGWLPPLLVAALIASWR
jgi:predicted PurR-regulated permease PerM